jgi:hydrogenase maturation factor
MNKGKVAETVLKRSVFKQFQVKRKEVLIGPGIGEDCSVIKLEADECVVLSTDPITGSTSQIGELAVHITLNDLAASGASPIGLMVTLLLPVGFSEQNLKKLMFKITQLAKVYNVQIIGGHTEITDVVNQPVVSITGVGKIKDDKVMLSKKMQAGMDIVMTKWAGIEGTSIIAHEGQEQLTSYYKSALVEDAKSLKQYLSVVKDSEIAMKYQVYAMHDVTEGGIYGALWEIGAKANLGMLVDQSKIPVLQETIEICEFFDLNPYKLIGSGSLLIVTDQSSEMIKDLEEHNIKATVIGQLTKGSHRQIKFEDVMQSIEPAKTDELYKALDQCQEVK